MSKLKDISEDVGISISAVSKYLQDANTNHVSEEVKKRIDESIIKFNYRRNVIAQSLSSKKTNIISILIPHDAPFSRNNFLNEILAGLESVLLKKEYNMIFLATHGNDSATMAKNQIGKGYGYDGFVLFGTRFCSKDDMKKNADAIEIARYPAVTLNTPEYPNKVNQVIFTTADQNHPIKYLIQQKHHRILLVAGNKITVDSCEEIEAYQTYYKEFGLPYDEKLIVYGGYERLTAKAVVRQAIKSKTDFTAIYCLSDTMAIGVYEAIYEAGLRIPNDISVIGKNDSAFSQVMNPPLSTLRIQLFEIGRCAAELLIKSIENEEEPRKVFIENELILRGSVRVND